MAFDRIKHSWKLLLDDLRLDLLEIWKLIRPMRSK